MSAIMFDMKIHASRTDRNGKLGVKALKNRRYLIYIGTRKGVALNDGMRHGLFGMIDGNKAEETGNIYEMGRYIQRITEAGIHTYRGIISFRENDAIRLGFDGRDRWEELIRNYIPIIAERLDIKIQNFQWVSGVHLEHGHPHLHFIAWDKAQGIKNPFLDYRISNQIRVDMIKDVYRNELAELQDIKNEARGASLNISGDFFGQFLKGFTDMSDKKFVNTVKELKTNPELSGGKMIYNRFSNAELAGIAQYIFGLMNILPKSGRLVMKLLPEDVREEVRRVADKLLEINRDCYREFNLYIEASVQLAEYFTGKEEAIQMTKANANDDLHKRLCNKVLQLMKDLRIAEYYANMNISYTEWQKHQAMNFIMEVFSFLSSHNAAQQNKLNLAKSGELSKQARIEFALKYDNSSHMNWERE